MDTRKKSDAKKWWILGIAIVVLFGVLITVVVIKNAQKQDNLPSTQSPRFTVADVYCGCDEPCNDLHAGDDCAVNVSGVWKTGVCTPSGFCPVHPGRKNCACVLAQEI